MSEQSRIKSAIPNLRKLADENLFSEAKFLRFGKAGAVWSVSDRPARPKFAACAMRTSANLVADFICHLSIS